jgi:serine/threonine-protein kinase HipA
LGAKTGAVDAADLDELTYLLESGSDRIGALDFQISPSKYVPRFASAASLEELLNAVRLVEEGVSLTPSSTPPCCTAARSAAHDRRL